MKSNGTSQLAQPDLLPAGQDSVAEVVQAESRGHLEGKVADHEREEGQDVFGALSILIIGVYRRTDDGCRGKLRCHLHNMDASCHAALSA